MAIITVKQANVVLDIPEEQKNEYLAKGFDIIGANGRVIERAVPNDVNSLKKAYRELTEEVKKLKIENKKLKAKLSRGEESEEPENEESEELSSRELRRRKRKQQ